MRYNDGERQRTVKLLRSLAASGTLAAIGWAVAAVFIHDAGIRSVFVALAVGSAVLAITKGREAKALRR